MSTRHAVNLFMCAAERRKIVKPYRGNEKNFSINTS